MFAGPFWGLKHGGLRGILQGHKHVLVVVLETSLLANVAGSLGLCIFVLITIPGRIYPQMERLPAFLVCVGVFCGLFGCLEDQCSLVVRKLLANLPAGPSSCFESPWAAISKH